MTYATVDEIQARMTRTMGEDERAMCENLLDDAAVIIDAYNASAKEETKRVVSCRIVVRAIGDGGTSGYPLGASQGSMTGLGYSQSWTMGTGGGVGEIYLSRLEKKLLGVGNRIGSRSPAQNLAPEEDAP